MAWNPFKAIGEAIGRVFTREEVVTQEEEYEPQARGLFSRVWGRLTGTNHRWEEEEREHELEERERQLEERQREVEERELALSQRVQVPSRDLPKFVRELSDYQPRGQETFSQGVGKAIVHFLIDRGGIDGLNTDAREWLETPRISEIFSDYWISGGFSADQVLSGMKEVKNIKITENDDGGVNVAFDYESEIDGYPVAGHVG